MGGSSAGHPERRQMNSFYGNKESLIKSLKVGDTISLTEEIDGHKSKQEYVITEIYPYMVRAIEKKKTGKGEHRCFNYGELITMGCEVQSLDMEALRKDRESASKNKTQYHSRKEV